MKHQELSIKHLYFRSYNTCNVYKTRRKSKPKYLKTRSLHQSVQGKSGVWDAKRNSPGESPK